MITLAFYKGSGRTRWERLKDSAIRFATCGIYSHVELIEGAPELGQLALCYSSSSRDGGVRAKWIPLDPGRWDLVHLPIDSGLAVDFIQQRIGAKYDYLGILLSHVLAASSHDKQRWFCSEICAAAIGFDQPNRFSPQLLFDLVTL